MWCYLGCESRYPGQMRRPISHHQPSSSRQRNTNYIKNTYICLTCKMPSSDLNHRNSQCAAANGRGMRNGRVETLTGGRQLIIIIFLRPPPPSHTSPERGGGGDLQVLSVFSTENVASPAMRIDTFIISLGFIAWYIRDAKCVLRSRH